MPLTIDGLFSAWAVYLDRTTDGSGNISQLADQAGGGRHAKQGDAGNRPALLDPDSALGGHPSVSFDASNNERLTVDATATDYNFLHGTAFTALVIFSVTGAGTDTTIYGLMGNVHTDPGIAFETQPSANSLRLQHRRDADNVTVTDSGNVVNGGNYAVVSYENGRSPEIEIRVNGNAATTAAGPTGAAGDATRQLDLGRRSQTTGRYYDDTISEWWIYSTAYGAGSDEVAALESYAAGRL